MPASFRIITLYDEFLLEINPTNVWIEGNKIGKLRKSVTITATAGTTNFRHVLILSFKMKALHLYVHT